MKNPIPHLLLGLVLISLPVGGHAQGRVPSAQTARKTFNLNFPGGSLQQLLDAIQSSSGETLNAMIPDESLKLPVPKLQLREVTTDLVLQSLNYLTEYRLGRIRPSGNIWVLEPHRDTREAKAYYVGHLLQRFSIEDVTTAIRTTWQLQPDRFEAELKFHEETQLLIALADKQGLQIASEVLEELQRATASPVKQERAANHADDGVQGR